MTPQQRWNEKHPEKLREASQKYKQRNREKVRDNYRKWYANNTGVAIAASMRWSRANPDKRRIYRRNGSENRRKYEVRKYKDDLNYRIAKALRCRLNRSVRSKAAGSMVRDLGCSTEELRLYIEKQFSKGMSWNNWSHTGWHLDHISPLSSFDLSDRDQFLTAAHYTNLQPLWATDNLRKGKKTLGEWGY